jgi:hypothetical protein
MAAFLFPIAVGVNVTWTTQCAAGASVAGQLFVCAKSPEFVPVIEILFIVSIVLPMLVMVKFFAVLVWPTVTELKLKLLVESFTQEGFSNTPLPL